MENITDAEKADTSIRALTLRAPGTLGCLQEVYCRARHAVAERWCAHPSSVGTTRLCVPPVLWTDGRGQIGAPAWCHPPNASSRTGPHPRRETSTAGRFG